MLRGDCATRTRERSGKRGGGQGGNDDRGWGDRRTLNRGRVRLCGSRRRIVWLDSRQGVGRTRGERRGSPPHLRLTREGTGPVAEPDNQRAESESAHQYRPGHDRPVNRKVVNRWVWDLDRRVFDRVAQQGRAGWFNGSLDPVGSIRTRCACIVFRHGTPSAHRLGQREAIVHGAARMVVPTHSTRTSEQSQRFSLISLRSCV